MKKGTAEYLQKFTEREDELLRLVGDAQVELPERLANWRTFIGDPAIYLNELNNFVAKNCNINHGPTNVQRVTEFMEFSKFGAMGQLFVIDALNRRAEECLSNREEFLRKSKGSFINGETFLGVCQEWLDSGKK